jgi:hypothetical protein
MFDLTVQETQSVGAGYFIPGIVCDDMAVAGAAIGLAAAVTLGWAFPKRYNRPTLTLAGGVGCVIGTAFEGLKYGLMVDAVWTTSKLLYSLRT